MRPQSDIRPSQDLLSTEMYERDHLQVVAPMGGGKTAAALTAARELIDEGFVRKAVVLAPKRVTRNVWRQEAAQWAHLHGLKIVLVAGTPAQRLKILMDPQYDIYLVGIDSTQWLVKVMRPLPAEHSLFDLLIIDESSRFRNPTSKRAKALFRISPRFNIKWELTGTPRPRGYEDQFNPLKILTDGKLWGKSFYQWRALNFHPLDYNQYTWGLHMHCREAIIRDINSVTVRLDPEDMPDLPALNDGPEHFIKIELPPSARDTYELMRKELVAKVDAGIITAANMAVATGKMEQIVQGFLYDEEHVAQAIHSEKIDALAEFSEGLVGQPTLLVYQFHEDLAALGRLFPKLPYLGKNVDDKIADRNLEAWDRGDLPFMAVHPASAGHGLNMQEGGARMIIYAPLWSGEFYSQIIKRIHRSGQKLPVWCHWLMATDTVDYAKYDRARNQISAQDAFNKHIRKV